MRTETGRTDRPNESRNCRPAAAAPSPGLNHVKKKRGVPDVMSETLFRSVCGILCGQQKSAKLYSFKKLPKSKENTRNPKISGVVLELLTRFELVTSSLPTTAEPSSPCCIRLCGVFLSKKDEVAACLFHCFRPLISPCGSRCGSELFQLIKERRQNIKYDRADDCPVRILIMMHQPVPQSRDLHPRDIRILRPEVL